PKKIALYRRGTSFNRWTAKTQAVMATKCERNRSSQVGVLSVRISGTSEATIGIMRIDESVTARNIAAIWAPLASIPTRIILAGSAQTEIVMKIASLRVIPASKANALNPTKDVIRISAGIEVMPRIPVRNQNRAERVSRSGDIGE